jgi:hypothetical protein
MKFMGVDMDELKREILDDEVYVGICSHSDEPDIPGRTLRAEIIQEDDIAGLEYVNVFLGTDAEEFLVALGQTAAKDRPEMCPPVTMDIRQWRMVDDAMRHYHLDRARGNKEFIEVWNEVRAACGYSQIKGK